MTPPFRPAILAVLASGLAAGACGPASDGAPTLLWSADASSAANPFPSDRLRAGGHAGTPDGYFSAMLPPGAEYDQPRAFMDAAAAEIGTSGGYSVYAPVVLKLSREIAPDEVTGVHLFSGSGGPDLEVSLAWSEAFGGLLVSPVRPLSGGTRYVLAVADPRLSPSRAFRAELETDDGSDTDAAAAAAIARGIATDPRGLDLALAFTTQPIADELQAVQASVDAVLGSSLVPSFAPTTLPVDFTPGVFLSTSAGFQAAFTGDSARTDDIGVLAQGTWNAIDFRGADGLFDAGRIAGTTSAGTAVVDFRLTVPAGSPPPAGWPLVIVSHGVSGDSTEVMQRAYSFAGAGMAVIGATAPDHGYRGSILDFFDFTRPLFVRDEFRQSAAEILQLERMVRNAKTAGVAPFDRLDTDRVTYFGNSFGGLVGGSVAGASTHLDAIGLTVSGGRLHLLLAGQTGTFLLGIFQGNIGFPADPAPGVQEDFLEALGILAQWALDPADPGAMAIAAPPGLPVLIQQAAGDATILNESTEAMRLAYDVPVVDAPADPFAGRGAMWIWDVADYPAVDTSPHDLYWDLAPMRTQMETWLLTEGGVLTGG